VSDPDYTHLAPAVTALGDQLEAVVDDLARLLAAKDQLSDRIFELLGDDAEFEEGERAAEETGFRRLIGLSLEAHAQLRAWCIPDRIERARGNDYGPG
jgi:hypothetical protein